MIRLSIGIALLMGGFVFSQGQLMGQGPGFGQQMGGQGRAFGQGMAAKGRQKAKK